MRPARHASRREKVCHCWPPARPEGLGCLVTEKGWQGLCPRCTVSTVALGESGPQREVCPRGGRRREGAGAGLQVTGGGDTRDSACTIRGPSARGLRDRLLKSDSHHPPAKGPEPPAPLQHNPQAPWTRPALHMLPGPGFQRHSSFPTAGSGESCTQGPH